MADYSKICKTCLREKPITEFNRHSSTKDGHRNDCAKCTAESTAEWKRNNPDKVRANVEKHREKRREAAKLWREANPLKVKAQRERARIRRQEKRNG